MVSNEKTVFDLKIKETLNLFQTLVQQNVEISTLEFEKLTEKFKILTLNLAEELSPDSDCMPLFLKQDVQVEEIVSRPGRVDAVLFWFEMAHPYSEVRVSTADPASHYKVAAHMLEVEDIFVAVGQKLNLCCELERSDVTISIKM